MRLRQRRDTDRDFFVQMVSASEGRKVSVGNFYADSAGEACDMAKRQYPGLFVDMETRDWSVQASEVVVARRHVGGT